MLSSSRTAAIGIPSPIAGGVHGGEGDAAGQRGRKEGEGGAAREVERRLGRGAARVWGVGRLPPFSLGRPPFWASAQAQVAVNLRNSPLFP